MSELAFIVRKVITETPDVRAVVLESASDAALPQWQPGAHIRVKLPAGGDRPYSLVDHPEWRGGRYYVIGVRLEEESAGGSKYIHGLSEGDRVTATGPINQFELRGGDGPVVLLAGGIGITPILSMASKLDAENRDFRMHYCGRASGELAFLEALTAFCGERMIVHYDDTPPGRPDFAALIAEWPENATAYVCGPSGMIDAVKDAWAAAGRPPDHLVFELFTPTPASVEGDTAFDVKIASTGDIVTVEPGQSIIEALEAAGHDVIYDCQRGDCGICQTAVLEGVPDHRDVVLSDEEKASNTVMQICVSRSKTPLLVLDL